MEIGSDSFGKPGPDPVPDPVPDPSGLTRRDSPVGTHPSGLTRRVKKGLNTHFAVGHRLFECKRSVLAPVKIGLKTMMLPDLFHPAEKIPEEFCGQHTWFLPEVVTI